MRSLKPLITAGWFVKPGAELTIPSTLSQARDAVEVPQRPLQVGEDRQPHELRRLHALLQGQVTAHLAAHVPDRPVRIQRPVPGDDRAVAANPHRHEGQRPARQPLRRRQHKTEFLETLFDLHGKTPCSRIALARAAYAKRLTAATLSGRRTLTPFAPLTPPSAALSQRGEGTRASPRQTGSELTADS